jgi:hypothetical protein
VRLYAKEMVQKNFPGLPSDQLLDRLIELSLYTEENLRQVEGNVVGIEKAKADWQQWLRMGYRF